MKHLAIAVLLLLPWGFMSTFLLQLQDVAESFDEPLSFWVTYQVIFVGVILGVLVLIIGGYKTRDSSKLTDALLDAGMAVCVSLALTPFTLGFASFFGKAFVDPKFFQTWQATLGAAFILMLVGMRIRNVITWFIGKYTGNSKEDSE